MLGIIGRVDRLTPLFICSCLWLAWLAIWIWAARRVQATRWSEGILARLQHTVPFYIALFLIFRGPTSHLLRTPWHQPRLLAYAGVPLTGLGLGFSVWARVHLGRYWSGIITLKQDHRIVRTGPYAIVRHPIYTGLVFAALGSALAAGTADALLGAAILIPLFLLKLHREEKLLAREFGDEYARFQREVPALIPFVF